CATCHDLIDPIGLGFERYDNLGQYRAKQVLTVVPDGGSRRDAKEIELEIDTTARIAGIDGSEFETVKELGGILANEGLCQKCVVKQIFRYALGRHENEADQPYLDEIFGVFQES